MPAIELVKYVERQGEGYTEEEDNGQDDQAINLLEIPARRMEVTSIHLQATLEEALKILDELEINALYVERMNAPGIQHIYGILTRKQIESAYQFK